MSEPKWTQGGWRYHHPSPWPMDIRGPVHRIVAGEENYPTAFVPAWLDTDREEAEANARLIAASPDFADIAARAQYLANERGGDYSALTKDELCAFMVEYDDALTKARGDS